MNYIRKPASEITPEYEDTGLFKSEIGQILAELVPQMSRNSRQDLVIRGFINTNTEIAVVFAGRRVKEATPLEAQLKAMLSRANKAALQAEHPAPEIEDIRFPVRIEGAWRPRFHRDKNGWETRSFQFIAARWSVIGKDGNTVLFGSRPAITPGAP